MSQTVRTTITLLVLCAAVVLAAAWGWSAATEPLPAKVDQPICVDTPVGQGDKLYPQEVTVSVYNAGGREGLAAHTMQELKDAGFAVGQAGNVKAKLSTAAIWADSATNPAVQLVASHLGNDVRIQQHEGIGLGVTVVVGDKFTGVVKGEKSVVSEEDTEVCSPPVD